MATSSHQTGAPALSGSLKVKFAVSREKILPKNHDGFSMKTQIHKFNTPSIDYSMPQLSMPEFREMRSINTTDIFYKNRKAWDTINTNQNLSMPSVADIEVWDKSWQSGQYPSVFDTHRNLKTTPDFVNNYLNTSSDFMKMGIISLAITSIDFFRFPIMVLKHVSGGAIGSVLLGGVEGGLKGIREIAVDEASRIPFATSFVEQMKIRNDSINMLENLNSNAASVIGAYNAAKTMVDTGKLNAGIDYLESGIALKGGRGVGNIGNIGTNSILNINKEIQQTIYLSDFTTTSSTTKSEMKLLESMLSGQSNVTLQGPSPAFEQFKYDHPDNTSIDPIGIKQSFGTVVQIKHVTPEYKHLNSQNDAIMDIYQSLSIEDYDKNFGQSSIPKDMTPNKMPEFPGYDNWKLKAQEYYGIPGGGQPPPPPSVSNINDFAPSAFPHKNLSFENDVKNKYLPISFKDFGNSFGQPDVKGVMLRGAASLDEEADAFGGGDVSLVFQDSAGVIDIAKLRSFVTALWAAYLSIEGPGISIDPAEPKMDYQKVRYIGQVKNTYLGCVMRETDYLMKQWAIGTYRPNIEGFLTSDDISEILKKNKDRKRVTGRPSRFWLIPDGLAFTRSGNMLLLSGGRMTVQTEYLDDNPKGEKNEANEAFAQWFTKDYKLISAHYPIFQELFDYAQLVSLGTYLRENRVPMLRFLLSNRELIITERSIDKVDKLKKKSDYKWNITISGGVEFDVTGSVGDEKRYTVDETLKDDFEYVKNKYTGSDNIANSVVFNSNGTDYTVTSNQSLMLSGSPATGDIVQTDFAFWNEYDEMAGKEKWHLVTPAMELIRYYNPKIKTRAQLGPGWHLLVPFRLEDNENSMPLTAGVLPSRIAMVNLLSGEREVMKATIDKKTKGINYAPLDKNAFASVLVPVSNGSWVLKDCLGATFSFDSEGDLTHLVLRPEKTISFKVGDKSYKRKIPGYIVKYKYDIKNINGIEQKMLVSVRQGNEIAQITRVIDNLSDKIASIQVQHVGQGKPIEILDYMYNEDGRLANVLKKSGHKTQIKYEDSDMRIVAVYQ